MRNIKELVKETKKYNDIIIQKQFDSKKNTVAYVTYSGKPRLLKWYAPAFQKNMENEYSILKKGYQKLNIPPPYEIDKKNNVLVMNYILGKNLCDVINDDLKTFEKKQKIIESLALWFIKFHKLFKKNNEFIIRGDCILRNFILKNQIWGVDFEESRKGKPEEDIARMCSSILTTDPMFTTEKYQLCKIFIDTYSQGVKWKLTDLSEEISYSLLEKIQWRPNDEELLRTHAKKIRKRGLNI